MPYVNADGSGTDSVMAPASGDAGTMDLMMNDGTAITVPANITPQDAAGLQAKYETWKTLQAQAKTDSTWRPVATGIGQAAGMLAAGGGIAAAATPTGGADLAVAPAALYAAGGGGAAIGGNIYDQGMNIYRRLTGQPVADNSIGTQAGKAVEDAAWNTVAPGSMDVVAPYIGKAIGAAGSPFRTFLSLGKGWTDPATRQAFDDITSIGGVPTADLVNPNSANMGQSLRKAPFSGNVMATADGANVGAFQNGLYNAASGFGTVRTPDQMGAMLQRAVPELEAGHQQMFGDIFNDTLGQLPQGNIPTPATDAFFNQFRGKLPIEDRVAQKILPFMKDYDASIKTPDIPASIILGADGNPMVPSQPGTSTPAIPAAAAQNLRTLIGKVFNGNADDLPLSYQKQLWGALSEDLGDAFTSAGPEARNAWDNANSMYSAYRGSPNNGVTGIQDVLDSIKSAPDPRAAYTTVANALSNKNTSGDYIGKLLGTFPESLSGDLKATLLSQMGQARPGVQNALVDAVSPATFGTNWAGVDDATKQILGWDQGDPMKMARIAGYMKALGSQANTSGTGGNLAYQALVNSGAAGAAAALGFLDSGHPLSAAGTLATAAAVPASKYLTAKAMTNPEVVNNLIYQALAGSAPSLTPGWGNAMYQMGKNIPSPY